MTSCMQKLCLQDHASIWRDPPADRPGARLQAIILTGSRHDAYATDDWNMKLREIIKTAHARQQRILGHCFGCQITNVVLGGTVGERACLCNGPCMLCSVTLGCTDGIS